MIEMKSISFSYGERTVLQNLTYTFPQKGVIALMGPSGEGKTTLMRLLCGLEKAQEGTLTVTYKKIAYAFQEPRLIPWLNSVDNINFVLPKEKKGSDAALALLRDFELEKCAFSYPAALSGGMKQRLSLARALAVGGDLLLLDEPFSGLDQALKERLAPKIKNANSEGLTLLVTHDAGDAELLGATLLTLSATSYGTQLS